MQTIFGLNLVSGSWLAQSEECAILVLKVIRLSIEIKNYRIIGIEIKNKKKLKNTNFMSALWSTIPIEQ